MSMRRDTEFRWQAQSGSRSKFFMSLLLCVGGLATGYMFVTSGRQAMTVTASETARAMAVPAKPASEEHSGVATAAPVPVQLLNPSSVLHSADLASDEPSTVAIKAPPRASSVAAASRTSPTPRAAVTRQPRRSNYVTLRQALLRNVR